MDFYVTIGDIKDTIHTYWNDHHTSSKFPEILHILYENKKYLDYEPVLPDIGALARLDDDSFLSEIRKLYFRFPYTILSDLDSFDVVPPTSHINFGGHIVLSIYMTALRSTMFLKGSVNLPFWTKNVF